MAITSCCGHAVLLVVAMWCGCAQAVVRKYYIAAEEVMHNYAPSGRNNFENLPMEEGNSGLYLTANKNVIGPVFKKALYFQYTDDTFTVQVPKSADLGFLGPVIRAEVGDAIEVTFMNKCDRLYTMHPHGVRYTQDMEGSLHLFDATVGAGVGSNGVFVYKWDVPARAGPGTGDGVAAAWAYHSHHDEPADVYSGLMGPLMVYAAGTLNAAGLPTDVTREYFAFFQVTNENLSHYLTDNCKMFRCNFENGDFEESNLKHNINGRMYANLDGLDMQVGETVRWVVAAFGTEVDLHSGHWHGNTVVHDGHTVDVIELMPATFRVAYMTPDMPGKWPLHCHVNDHMTAGMSAFYSVTGATPAYLGDTVGVALSAP